MSVDRDVMLARLAADVWQSPDADGLTLEFGKMTDPELALLYNKSLEVAGELPLKDSEIVMITVDGSDDYFAQPFTFDQHLAYQG